MIFVLNERDIALLNDGGISYSPSKDYSDDEALAFLDKVRDLEVEYAQDYGNEREKLFYLYGDLADKIQNQIPD